MLQAGQRLDDYKIVGFFAGGGMGEIYLAEEVSLGRQVAIKVLRPEAIRYPDSEDSRKATLLFRREATAIARLNHPYILPLYRFGEATVDGLHLMYMVMPYCQEKSLSDWMQAHRKTVFSPQEVDLILRQAAEALQFAHNQGVIHLDIKPSNFLVRYQTDDASKLNLQLMDFGVARFTATTGMSQTVRGSLEYMAPEQWEGQPVFATDQYALAIMIYKLLTGQTPFTGSGFEHFWHQHRYAPPPPPGSLNPSIPPALDAVILRALAKNPNDRYPSLLAFADAYSQALRAPQIKPTEYAVLRQTLTLSQDEASRGVNRVLTLPTGEQVPVTIPPGAYQGQVIPVPRPNGPTVLIEVQVIPSQTLPPLPPSPPPPATNRRKTYIAAGLAAALLIIAGLGIGIPVYSHSQYTAQLTATAQAQDTVIAQQTQAALNAQATQTAQAILNAQATQTAAATFPTVTGNYAGTYQFTTSSASGNISLSITQQNGQSFGGTCTIDSSNFDIQNGTVTDQSGDITFTINATINGTNTVVTFTGTAQSPRGWQGNFSDTLGDAGTWNAA
jgi:serine/threonine protein kinase